MLDKLAALDLQLTALGKEAIFLQTNCVWSLAINSPWPLTNCFWKGGCILDKFTALDLQLTAIGP